MKEASALFRLGFWLGLEYGLRKNVSPPAADVARALEEEFRLEYPGVDFSSLDRATVTPGDGA